MTKRNVLKEQAQVFITQLKAEYDAKLNSKELDKFKDDAKAAYKDDLSKQYYKIANGKRELFRAAILAAGKEEIVLEKKIAYERKQLKQINGQKPEELLKQNNALLHAGFMLQNGNVMQITDLIERYKDNEDVIEMIKAQSNKKGYESIKSPLGKIENDEVDHLENEVATDDAHYSSKFPYLTGFAQDPYVLFGMEKSLQHDFFK